MWDRNFKGNLNGKQVEKTTQAEKTTSYARNALKMLNSESIFKFAFYIPDVDTTKWHFFTVYSKYSFRNKILGKGSQPERCFCF